MYTRSVPTAAALWLLTNTEPTVADRRGVRVFEFPDEVDCTLSEFLKRKRALERMLDGEVSR